MDSHLLDQTNPVLKRKARRDKFLLRLFLAVYLPIELIVSFLLGPILMPLLKPTDEELN